MKKYCALCVCLLLGACTDSDWNNALNYTGLGGKEDASAEAVQPATPAANVTPSAQPAQEVPNNDLCKAVATQDATSNDFDPPTQQRVFARSYAQCLAIYTR
jgi:hypothetical protein